MLSHVINEKDWPDFRNLLAWWRSSSVASAQGPRQSDATETETFVLLEPLESGGNARAIALSPTPHYVQDIFIPDDSPAKFRLGIGRSRIEYFTDPIFPQFTALAVEELLRESPIAEHIERVELGYQFSNDGSVFYGRRWKVVYKAVAAGDVGIKILPDPLQPRLFISESQFIESGRIPVVLNSGLATEQPIPVGTQVQAVYLSGYGWTVSEFEKYEPPEEPAEITVETTSRNCRRQIIPAGVSSDCPACGDDAPEGFNVSFNSSLWKIVRELFDDSDTEDAADEYVTTHTLLHDSGCVYQSDLFADDSLKWKLTIHNSETNGPAAKLELIAVGGTLYTTGLHIIYWSEAPFDALSINSFVKISAQSKGTPEYPRHEFPGCLTVHPYSQPCEDSEQMLNGWNCTKYWSAFFNGSELVAGPPEPLEDEAGCQWPSYEPDKDPAMKVEFFRGNARWDLVVTVTIGGIDVEYKGSSTGTSIHAPPNPSCFGMTLLRSGAEIEGTPEEIKIAPWQK